jgi:hypothetical protein
LFPFSFPFFFPFPIFLSSSFSTSLVRAPPPLSSLSISPGAVRLAALGGSSVGRPAGWATDAGVGRWLRCTAAWFWRAVTDGGARGSGDRRGRGSDARWLHGSRRRAAAVQGLSSFAREVVSRCDESLRLRYPVLISSAILC